MSFLKVTIARWFSLLSVLIFFLIVVGGLVRNLGAGLSCPDWPLCQGRLIPVFDIRVFAEYFHRLFAASVSFLTLGLSVAVFRNPQMRKQIGVSMGIALALLASQVILGGLTVLQLLKSEIVTLHLATGTLFFATILTMNLKLRQKTIERPQAPTPEEKTGLFTWGKITTVILFGQIILGGVVSSHYAGLACPDFPKCLGEWWPGLTGIQGIHFMHRLGAVTAFTVILVYVTKIFSARPSHALRNLALGITVLLFCQVALGISNVLFQLPVTVSVAHLGVAEALFALILMSTYEIRNFQLR